MVAATAITISRSVASIGDMALLNFNSLNSIVAPYEDLSHIAIFNIYESEINILNSEP
jgi:hypothetical protein